MEVFHRLCRFAPTPLINKPNDRPRLLSAGPEHRRRRSTPGMLHSRVQQLNDDFLLVAGLINPSHNPAPLSRFPGPVRYIRRAGQLSWIAGWRQVISVGVRLRRPSEFDNNGGPSTGGRTVDRTTRTQAVLSDLQPTLASTVAHVHAVPLVR